MSENKKVVGFKKFSEIKGKSKIEEIEIWNSENPPNLHKSFKLIDISYAKS